MNRTILAAITLLLAITLQAQKRVNNRLYNPDPAPVVSGDRLYVFTGHDLDTATVSVALPRSASFSARKTGAYPRSTSKRNKQRMSL